NLRTGGGGDETLDGGLGNDTLDGGAGADTASFASATAGVNVNLGATATQYTLSLHDALPISIENIIGSTYNDTLEGSSGDNLLSGGGGTDTLTYAHAGAGVAVDLTLTGAQDTKGAGVDTLSGFTNLVGSSFNDVLRAGVGTHN